MSKTTEITTVHGDIEYETRTCASCEQEHLPEDVQTLYTGTVNDVSDYSSFESIKFKPSAERVYLCEYCHERPTKLTLQPTGWESWALLCLWSVMMLVIGSMFGVVL